MASPFSFHCMICFEGFHPEDRYPVVLPCGHTYVCNQCAERLDKCMECRTPLAWSIPRSNAASGPVPTSPPGASRSSWSSARSGQQVHRPGPGSPPQVTKKRLPLPKNVVLLSLMDATELATHDDKEVVNTFEESTESIRTVSSMLDQEEEEEEKIRAGTSLAISVCGTYVVACPEGLEVYPSRPTSMNDTSEKGGAEEDVDTLVRFFYLDHKMDSVPDDNSIEERDSNEEAPARLALGDRVQIVSLENGWAKLARGYGYVRAEKNALVKIGGSVDRACNLEAMLRFVTARRKELRKEQNKVDNQFIKLMNDLQMSLLSDEDFTVVAADAFSDNAEVLRQEFAKNVEERDTKPQGREERTDNDSPDDWQPRKPHTTTSERPPTPPMQLNTGFSCFANDVFQSISGSGEQPRQPEASSPALADTYASSIGDSALYQGEHPSPSVMRAGARAWRERNGRSPSGSQGQVGSIDFRTGMSGHTALLSSSSHPHSYLNHSNARPGNLRMSSHTGLTMQKPPKIFANLHLPTFCASTDSQSVTSTPPAASRSVDYGSPRPRLDRTGSM